MEKTQNTIKPLQHFKVIKRKIIVFDTEDNSKGDCFLVNFYDGLNHTPFWISEENYLDDMREVINFIYEHKRTYFYAHNLEYDINNIFSKFNYSHIDEMSYTSRLMSVRLKDSTNRFLDSFNYWATSLANIGKTIGLQKGDTLTALKGSKEEQLDYCKRDCEILYKFLEGFQTLVNKELKINLGGTIGRLAMDAYRMNFQTQNIIPWNLDPAKFAYYGGRTEAFFIGNTEGNIELNDINSSYPSSMLELFPNTARMQKDPNFKCKFGVGKFKMFVPKNIIPPLPYKSDEDKLIFPTGIFEGYYCYNEIFNAVEHGAKVLEWSDCWGTNAGNYPFTDYVKVNFQKRLNAKESKNEFLVLFFKLFLNNLYGKWGQKDYSTIVKIGTKIPEEELQQKNGKLVRSTRGIHFYYFETDKAPETANWLWGSYITAYSRIKLYKGLVSVQNAGRKLLYCDTDSIASVGDKKHSLPITKKLGDWDSSTYSTMNIYGAKTYVLDKGLESQKIACKGVPSKFALEFLETGTAAFEKPVKMREGLVQDLTINLWKTITKNMNSVYNKGEILSDGTVIPFDLQPE